MNRTGASRSNPSGNPKGTIPVWIKIPLKIMNMNDIIDISKREAHESPNLIKRVGYSPYNREKKRIQRKIAIIVKPQFRGKIKELSKYTFYWLEENWRRDPDNISTGQKFIFDSLKDAGIIENDGHKQVGVIEHRFGKHSRYMVIIEITPHTRADVNLGIHGTFEM